MRSYVRSLAAGAVALVAAAATADAAVNVGTLDTVGETITGGQLFNGSFNSNSPPVGTEGGLEFTLATAGTVLFSI